MVYNIYSNHGTGGPVDYSTPIGSTSDLSFTVGPLDPSSDNRFAVRALDPATNLEEANTDACVRILLDASGNDITARPNPPHALSLRPYAGGGCRASWAYNPAGQGGPPVGFYLYLATGGTPSYGSPAAVVPYTSGTVGYSYVLGGLAAGTTYAIAVRSYNATATEDNATVFGTFRAAPATGSPVDSLTAVPA